MKKLQNFSLSVFVFTLSVFLIGVTGCDKGSDRNSGSSGTSGSCADDYNLRRGDCEVNPESLGRFAWSANNVEIGGRRNQSLYRKFMSDLGVCYSGSWGYNGCETMDEYISLTLETDGLLKSSRFTATFRFKDNQTQREITRFQFTGCFRPGGPRGVMSFSPQSNSGPYLRCGFNAITNRPVYNQGYYNPYQTVRAQSLVAEIYRDTLERGPILVYLYYDNDPSTFFGVTLSPM